MKWSEAEQAKLADLKERYYKSMSGVPLTQMEMIEIKDLEKYGAFDKAEEYRAARTAHRAKKHYESTQEIRKESVKIIGKELSSYFFPTWGTEDFKKFLAARKKYKIRGYGEDIRSYAYDNHKPFGVMIKSFFRKEN